MSAIEIPSHDNVVLGLPNGWLLSIAQTYYPDGRRGMSYHGPRDQHDCEVLVIPADGSSWNNGVPKGWISAAQLVDIITSATEAALAAGPPERAS